MRIDFQIYFDGVILGLKCRITPSHVHRPIGAFSVDFDDHGPIKHICLRRADVIVLRQS